MAALSLDTHKLVKELTATGFSEEQAEAVTRAVLVGRELDLSHLATEAGVAAEGGRLEQRIDEQVRRLELRIDEVDRKIDAVHAELDRKIDQLDRKIDAVHAQLDRKIDTVQAELNRKIDRLDAKIDAVRADLEVLRRDMTIRLGAMIAAAVVLVTVLDRLI